MQGKRKWPLRALMIFLGIGIFASCSSLSQKHHIPTLTQAESLRGQRFPEVQAQLGAPQDRPGPNRYVWSLTQDSEHHPQPTVELFEFIFVKNKLVEIKNLSEKR